MSIHAIASQAGWLDARPRPDEHSANVNFTKSFWAGMLRDSLYNRYSRLRTVMTEKEFTPALGRAYLTPFYDLTIAVLTRERLWRGKLVELVIPDIGDRILDVGCGTGSLAIRLKAEASGSEVIGLDPDPEVLAKARDKAEKQGVDVRWKQGFLTPETVAEIGVVSNVVSSLVFHQTPIQEKATILLLMLEVLRPGGVLYIADYGLQRTKLMRILFRRTVQTIDGLEDTQPNADGCLPDMIASCGFQNVEEIDVIPTITGSISLYRAKRPH
tara:strand:+ start:402 stop:1214 length:813 start_codon:yes stop_codon:yes gene_type:complete